MAADFEKLDVYQAAIEFAIAADALVQRLPPGRLYLVDQLRRAASSIALNIAEGTGEFSKADKARFYRMARRSGYECIAVLDLIAGFHIGDATELRSCRLLLDRIGAMLTKMIASVERTAPGFVRESPVDALDSDSESDPDPDSGGARLASDSDSGES